MLSTILYHFDGCSSSTQTLVSVQRLSRKPLAFHCVLLNILKAFISEAPDEDHLSACRVNIVIVALLEESRNRHEPQIQRPRNLQYHMHYLELGVRFGQHHFQQLPPRAVWKSLQFLLLIAQKNESSQNFLPDALHIYEGLKRTPDFPE